jgi:DNA primase
MAGRIPQNFIDELLDRVDIVELIDHRVTLKKAGKNYTACCPFHDEKTPSFSVNPDKQFYYCFGCGAGGNALGFLMEYDRLGFPEAVEELAKQQGMEVPREAGDDPDRGKRQDLYSILEQASQYYQEQLRSHPQAGKATDYLKQRGLIGQIAHRFGIGYAPPGWDNLLKTLGQSAPQKQLLLESGMLVDKPEENKCYDRFRERIMFPIRDARGRVIAFGGRVLGDEKPKYLNSPETPVFNKGRELYGLYEANQANRQLQRLLVVEGYMDVVALAQFGIEFATATLGTAASAAHLEKAFRHAPEVVFCFDGDEAGRRAARRALEESLPALAEGRQVRFMFLPEGEDPDAMVRQYGAEDFRNRIAMAQPLSEYLFDTMSEGLDLETAEGRSMLVSRVVPAIQKVPEGIYRDQLQQLLATQGRMDPSRLERLVQVVEQAPPPHHDEPPPVDYPEARAMPARREGLPDESHRLTMAEEAFSLLLQNPALVEHCDGLEQLVQGGDAQLQKLLELSGLLRQNPEASTNRILGLWHGFYGAEGSDRIYRLAARERLIDQEAARQQFIDILERLKRRVSHEIPLDQLIEKARNGTITREETEELNRLLQVSKGVDEVPGKTGEGGNSVP